MAIRYRYISSDKEASVVADPRDIVSKDAYIVFYSRVQNDVEVDLVNGPEDGTNNESVEEEVLLPRIMINKYYYFVIKQLVGCRKSAKKCTP